MIFQQSKLGVGGFNLDDGLYAESTGETVTLSSGMDMQGPKLKFPCKHYLRKRESVTFSSWMDIPGAKLKFTCKQYSGSGSQSLFPQGWICRVPNSSFHVNIASGRGSQSLFPQGWISRIPNSMFICKQYLRKWESVTFSSGMDTPGPKRCVTGYTLPQKEWVWHPLFWDGYAGSEIQANLLYAISVRVDSHPLIRDGYAGSEIQVSLL